MAMTDRWADKQKRKKKKKGRQLPPPPPRGADGSRCHRSKLVHARCREAQKASHARWAEGKRMALIGYRPCDDSNQPQTSLSHHCAHGVGDQLLRRYIVYLRRWGTWPWREEYVCDCVQWRRHEGGSCPPPPLWFAFFFFFFYFLFIFLLFFFFACRPMVVMAIMHSTPTSCWKYLWKICEVEKKNVSESPLPPPPDQLLKGRRDFFFFASHSSSYTFCQFCPPPPPPSKHPGAAPDCV